MKLPSKYTDKEITPAQYLAELMCERKYRKLGVSLPKKFWSDERYRKEFLFQKRNADQLLAYRDFRDILAALQDKRGVSIHSLSAKWLDPIIEEFSVKRANLAKISETKRIEVTSPILIPSGTPESFYGGTVKTNLSKL